MKQKIQKSYPYRIKPYPLCLGNISKYFTLNNMIKTGLNRSVTSFSPDSNLINTRDV